MSSPPEPRRRRSTAKQRAVFEVLRELENFRSAQQLYLDVRRDRQLRIGLTSVYRILRTLTADRIAETQRAEDGEILYRLRTVQVIVTIWSADSVAKPWGFTPIDIEEHTRRLSRQHHYTDVTHYVDLYGICPQCRSAPGPDSPADKPLPHPIGSWRPGVISSASATRASGGILEDYGVVIGVDAGFHQRSPSWV